MAGDVMKTIRLLLVRSFSDWNDDNAPRLGASLAFYTILSISPLVLFSIAIVSLIFNRLSAQNLLLAQVHSLIGESGKDAVQGLLVSGQRHGTGLLSSVLGFLTLIFGASGVFTELRSALNSIWKVKPVGGSGLWVLVRERLFSFGMVLSVGFVLLVSLLASATLATVTKFFSGLLPVGGGFWQLINFLLSFAGITLLFGLIFRYVPETEIAWKDVRVGALVTALLFNLGKFALAVYLGKTTPGSAYGAAGSLVVMVIWVYYSAQIFFFGAELTHVYAVTHGDVKGAEDQESRKAA